MNENAAYIHFFEVMGAHEGWGRQEGSRIFQRLVTVVEEYREKSIFRICLKGVERIDASFASETVVELARRYRSNKGFCFMDMPCPNQAMNWDMAAGRVDQPLIVWGEQPNYTVLGLQPTTGISQAFQYIMENDVARAATFAEVANISIASASSKFKQLWERGFVMRREGAHGTGGTEYEYFKIK